MQAALNSDPAMLGSLVADAAGAVSGTLEIPPGTAPGQHNLTLSGLSAEGAPRELSTTLTVTAENATTTTIRVGTLARTGASVMHAMWSGYWFVVAGSLLVLTALGRQRLGGG